jgi:hypothetical protein
VSDDGRIYVAVDAAAKISEILVQWTAAGGKITLLRIDPHTTSTLPAGSSVLGAEIDATRKDKA